MFLDDYSELYYFIRQYQKDFVRDIDKFNLKVRSNNIDKVLLSAVQYVFGKYKTPRFLNKVWIDAYAHHNKKARTLFNSANINFVHWYIAIASGKSLFKEYAKPWMTKKETSNYILYGQEELTPYENIWFARAITIGCNHGWAKNIAVTLGRRLASDSNLEIMRFFVANPVRIKEMKELFDYMNDTFENNPGFTLKNRSLESVRVLSEEWHRIQVKQKHLSTLIWNGHPIDDYKFVENNSLKDEWNFKQIKTSKELVKEGHAMRHCVGSYARLCSQGHSSIWSLTRKNQHDVGYRRALTIEVRDNGHDFKVSQIRGIVNRLPTNQEKRVVNNWAQENGILGANYF